LTTLFRTIHTRNMKVQSPELDSPIALLRAVKDHALRRQLAILYLNCRQIHYQLRQEATDSGCG